MRLSSARYCLWTLVLALAACGGGDQSDTAPRAASSKQQRESRQGLGTALPGAGVWSPLIPLTLVPAAAAHLPDGKVLLWSANDRFNFGGTGQTYTSTFDPATGTATETLVSSTGHDMFCPGISNLQDGSLLVNGGDDAAKTSRFDPVAGAWSAGPLMNIPRGYPGNAVLEDGSVLTLGGSWSGGLVAKLGELWTEADGWRLLGSVTAPAGPDPAGIYRGDNHMWLFAAPSGQIFHAGPSANMNWVRTQGNGSITPAGYRGDDAYSQGGNASLFDIGKILKVGGAPAYDVGTATANSYVIDINTGASVRKVASMAYPRVFGNSVVLPNGQVMVVGGQTVGVPFSDGNSVLVPELWDPATETFTPLPPIAVGRNYHSVALLLADGRVMSGGGGLCGTCTTNHADVQVYTPHYLLNPDGTPATRPVITAGADLAVIGTSINVTTDSTISSFSLVRMSSNTHTVNNDQRRVPLQFQALGNNEYRLDIPGNPGVALPGYYMLFAFNPAGVPSVSKIVKVTSQGAPKIRNPGSQTTALTESVTVPVAPVPAEAGVTFAADGLPPGLSIDSSTGNISGTPTTVGVYSVAITATNALSSTNTSLLWQVTNSALGVRYVKLESISESAGGPTAAIADFNVLDGAGTPIPRAGWAVSADSSETTSADESPGKAIDADTQSYWHSQHSAASPVHPHSFVVDLGKLSFVGGFKYLPPSGATAGKIAGWRIYTSVDGVAWTLVGQGNFSQFANAVEEKTIFLNNLALGRPATQSSTLASFGPSIAVDGNQGVNGGPTGVISHTAYGLNGWWQVDLGELRSLNAIRLWNRGDCCQSRLSDFYVFVSRTDMTGRSLASLVGDVSIWRAYVSGAVGRQMLLDAKAAGRYVRVQLSGTGTYLSMAEVEVFGRTPDNYAPTLAQFADPSHAVGQDVNFGLSAFDLDSDPLTYTASNLPAGLTLNAASGLVSGRPTQEGTFQATLGVDDGRGGVASTSVTWTIRPPPLAVLPVNTAPVSAGDSITLTASSNQSSGVTYRWNFGDGTPETVFSATPSVSHTFAAAGLYTVTVTAQGSDGSTGVLTFLQAVTLPVAGPNRAVNSSNIVVEHRSSATDRVWMVNPDNDSVSVFDSASGIKLAEVAVGAEPRSLAVAPNGRVWVTNRGAAYISVIEPQTLTVVANIPLPRASQPFGIVFPPNGSAAFVALEATGVLSKLDPVTGVPIGAVVAGSTPRSLAIDAASSKVLVSSFITPAQPGESTGTVQTSVNAVPVGATVLSIGTADLSLTNVVTLRHSDKPDTSLQGRGVPNYLGAAVVSPDGATAWVPSKQDNIARGSLRDGLNLDFQNTVRAISSRIVMGTMTEDYASRIDHDNAGFASAAVFHPSGAFLFVALQTSRAVAVIDPISRGEIFRFATGRAPDGLAVSADGLTLYVNNFMDRTLGVYDLKPLVRNGQLAVVRTAESPAVTTERLSAAVLKGKQFFYDARDTRLARDAYLSCATCHIDGGLDGRTWDFTGMGEGLRNTVSLKGRSAGYGMLHWSGNFDEVQDFEGQIRALAGGTGLMADAAFNAGTRNQPLGDKKAGLSADLDALAAYLASLDKYAPSPNRNADGTLTSDAVLGKDVFAAQCTVCHGSSPFTDSQLGGLHNVGTLKPSSGLRLNGPLPGIDTPTLRDAWATAPYLHDGSAATVPDAIRAHTALALTELQIAQVASFVLQIGNEEPLVSAGAGGLRARYYPNATLSGNHLVQRVESVDFNWDVQAPAAGLPADNFSVRWTGEVKAPVSGDYQFRTLSDEGVRAWVNGVLVVDNWAAHTLAANDSSAINLVAGQKYIITVEYYDAAGSAEMHLLWNKPGAPDFVPIQSADLYPTLFPSTLNVASGKVASQSSTISGYPASRAVDGVTNGNGGAFVTHTTYETNGWWQVDLGSLQAVDTVTLWNRSDCCSSRLANFYVFVSTVDMTGRSYSSLLSDVTVWRYKVSGAVGLQQTLPVNAAGRYVRVQLSGATYLSMAEVEVNGRPASAASLGPQPLPSTNVALGMPATQSSDLGSTYLSSKAVDGTTTGTGQFVSHTNSDTNAWWQVDLAATKRVEAVTVWNRTDCCASRLSNFYIFVSNTDMTGRSFSALVADAAVWRRQVTALAAESESFTVNTNGRYVRIQLDGKNYLSLAEVEVIGRAP